MPRRCVHQALRAGDRSPNHLTGRRVKIMEKVKFHFDPRCPWCYQTSRWARRLEAVGEVTVDWGLFSLEVVNLPEGEDPRAIDARSGPILRSSVVLRDKVGREAVGAFYDAVGKRIWESGPPAKVDDTDMVRECL